jgi:hypothetical protein
MNGNPIRRNLLKMVGVVITAIPIISLSRYASANTNAAIRGQSKYQDSPKDDKSCISCLEFVPGKTEKDLGECKVISGDDEISPNGYCALWNIL